MTELLCAISGATSGAGHSVELAFDSFPPLREEGVYVVVPHEFQAWGDADGRPDARQRERTIALCTENPGTQWFEHTYQLVPQFAAAVSINRSSAAELQRRGIRCEHLQLGYTPLWDTWHREADPERQIDVLYFGAADPRRDPLLGELGGQLWAHRCQFLVPPLEPRTRPRPDFLKETDKYHRLRSAEILLNLHRTTSSALEWMRFLEAICNGCVVVSEPCLDSDPLVPGEHFVMEAVDQIAAGVNHLLAEPEQLRLMRERAYDFVRERLPMEPAAERLAELAAELPRQPPGRRASPSPALAAQHPTPPPSPRNPSLQGVPPVDVAVPPSLLRSIYDRLRGGRREQVRILRQSSAYAKASPRVSVMLAGIEGRQRESIRALESAAGSQYDAFELLILSEASNDRSPAAVSGFLDKHPALPALLLQKPVDHSLGRSLNLLAERARGEYLFVLDAMGEIYPSTLGRLLTALEADPDATFAYPMVAAFEGDRPVELLGSLPWEPERLEHGNWIDAMALLRRTPLLKLGGYPTDPSLAGWESFELWRKCAAAGGHGVHVAQVLARRELGDP